LILGGLPLFVLSGIYESAQLTHLDSHDWLAMGYATVFGSAIAYGVFFYFASRGNLTSLSSLTFLTPIFAIIFSNLVLGETLSILQWLGVVLTLASIYLINQREQLREKFFPPSTPKITALQVFRQDNTVTRTSTDETELDKLPKLQLFSKKSGRE
jgi:hypothetical protein